MLGGLLVAAMLMVTPGFLPGCFALAALISGDHQVQIGAADGQAVVRLHHAPHLANCHRHGQLSRLLIVFSEAQPSEPDHVLHFSGAAQYLEEREERSSVNESAAVAVEIAPFRCVDLARVSVSMCPRASVPPSLLAGLRTTVLLI
jgi:hypothetical protein